MDLTDPVTRPTALTEVPHEEAPALPDRSGESDPGWPDEVPRHAIAMLRELLASEHTPIGDLLETWVADVAESVRAGEFRVAAAWLNAVLVDPQYPPSWSEQVGAAFETLSRPEVLDDLLVRLAGSQPAVGGPELVAAWGRPLVDYMIDLMVLDDPPVGRRRLIEFLGWAGRGDVRVLATHIHDPRWFVARNLAIALGRTGRPSAVPALQQLTQHPEPRVRVEVLRSLALLDNEGTVDVVATGLFDRSSRVRHAALTLLRANPSPAVVASLAGAVESGRAGAEQARKLVAAIAERRHDGVTEALGRIAGRRSLTRAGRAGRDAARAALGRSAAGRR